jgi:hypothetical protein
VKKEVGDKWEKLSDQYLLSCPKNNVAFFQIRFFDVWEKSVFCGLNLDALLVRL